MTNEILLSIFDQSSPQIHIALERIIEKLVPGDQKIIKGKMKGIQEVLF